MHELSLTQSLVAIAEDHARRAGATVIRSITVEVGELSGAVPEALEFAFDVCSKGTLAEGAALILRRVPGHGRCGLCAAEAECGELTAVCPACGALAFELDAGRELRVMELEID
ncbi:MAG: hydrogenase maturation nickel metallochaperone HypA [Deltaproteobacteria bacterium]|nr:MAG: hydrogenase maturation nickel metallochaperone HypA [Deltaproteobacteria bacterium]